MEKHSVAIILINWNGYEYSSKCINSLLKCHYQNKTIILVDNNSIDGSLDKLREDYPGLKIISNGENLGFTGANNVAMEYALDEGCDFIMLLNNDTEVEPDFLGYLVDSFNLMPNLGAIQPKIHYEYDRGIIWNAGGRFNKWTGVAKTVGEGQKSSTIFENPGFVDWITGCCIMLPSDVIKSVGKLDNRYFAYYEDVDWSLRINKAGYTLFYEPKSVIYHVAGASSKKKIRGKEGLQSPLVHYLNMRNHLFLIRTHLKFPEIFIAFLAYLFKLTAYIVYFIIRGRWSKLRNALKGFMHGISQAQ